MTTENTEGTERATPETDKAERMAFSGEYMVPTEVARRLERQRDEAREQLEVSQGIINRTQVARNSALADLTEVERERDEARELNVRGLALITSANDLAEILLSEIKELKADRRELQKQVLDLKIELADLKRPKVREI